MGLVRKINVRGINTFGKGFFIPVLSLVLSVATSGARN